MTNNSASGAAPFLVLFGISPRTLILEFFLEMRDLDFSIGAIARELGMCRATAYNTMHRLLAEELVIPSRKVGNAQLYKLNLKSKKVHPLIEVFDEILAKWNCFAFSPQREQTEKKSKVSKK